MTLHRSIAIALLASTFPLAAAAQKVYSLKTVEAQPIPRAELFQLWKDVAVGLCKDAPKNHNLSVDACRRLVTQRADACTAKVFAEAPQVIRTTAESKVIGRELLHCASPYYFCHGEEVKTEAEVAAKCGPRPAKGASR